MISNHRLFLILLFLVSCNGNTDKLSVSKDYFEFPASGGDDYLIIETNAEDFGWENFAGSWLEVSLDYEQYSTSTENSGTRVKLHVTSNSSGNSRSTNLKIIAGDAKPIEVTIYQSES